jgi:hypothetical protein
MKSQNAAEMIDGLPTPVFYCGLGCNQLTQFKK